MNSSAPARSGPVADRLAPRSTSPFPGAVAAPLAVLAALLLAGAAGCAQLSPSDRVAAPAGRVNGATGGQTDTPAASAPAAVPPAGAAPSTTDTAIPSPAPAAPPSAAPASAAPASAASAKSTVASAEEASTADQSPKTAAVAGIPRVQLSSQLLFQILASEIAAQRGQNASAANTYLSMARQTRDPRLARRATELALAERGLQRAFSSAQLWYELEPGSAQAQRAYESLLIATGRMADAEPLVRTRLADARAEGTLQSFYPQLQRLLSRADDPGAAFVMLDRVAEHDQRVVQARLALAAQARVAGLDERATAEADAAMKLAPDDEAVIIDAARIVGHGPNGPQAALARLEPFLGRNPRAVDARLEAARWLLEAERRDEATVRLEEALAVDPQNPRALIGLAQLAAQDKQPQQAERYLLRYVELPDSVRRDNAPAWLLLGQISEEAGRHDEALERYKQVPRGEQYVAARMRAARMLARDGSLAQGRQLLQQSETGNDAERVRLISAEAALLRENGQLRESFDLLEGELKRRPDHPELLYDLAMAAERIDRIDLLEKHLRRLIELRPDHAHAYNALGYTLADRNLRLDEAHRLIAKALELRPDDPQILDSMGWVEFRLGNLKAAVALLRRAYALSPDVEIAAHYGEALHRSGEPQEALKIWREGLAREADNTVLRQTLQRLGVQP